MGCRIRFMLFVLNPLSFAGSAGSSLLLIQKYPASIECYCFPPLAHLVRAFVCGLLFVGIQITKLQLLHLYVSYSLHCGLYFDNKSGLQQKQPRGALQAIGGNKHRCRFHRNSLTLHGIFRFLLNFFAFSSSSSNTSSSTSSSWHFFFIPKSNPNLSNFQ